uniref:CHAT domain-containing protein n=1 Tax=Desertifilum tharense IPPAS B-1220 TaxID=1781255 RepID=A0A1E5QH46_9CYAN|nr:CHAT domain-containing protein [Desertifilum tharense]OEJ74005.1 hypothetical protein BH720_16760 [Desertifilum tharense IPPAS B-1220]
MDEQRLQAYGDLIQELLRCPSGEANRILNQHSKLVDEGLVQVLVQVAQQLQSVGRENEAGFLLDLAQPLAEYLNRTTNSGTQSNATPEEYFRFLMEVLQAITKSNNDPKVVYPLLAQHQDKLDLMFAEILKRWFESELDPNNSERNQVLAVRLNSLAIALCQFPLGSRANNLEIAIASYKEALQVYTRQGFPQDWATMQNNLANAYRDRIQGDRAENLELAIALYQQALQVRTHQAFPQDWAMTRNNLANAYSDRIRGNRAENLELAIALYQQALQVYTRQAFPQDWAGTQNNLANAYLCRIRGDRAENLEEAIASYQQALQVCTRQAFPKQWAMTQNNLGNAYRDRIRGDRAENLELAIASCQQALQVYTRQAFPQDWAGTQNNLANAYSNRIRGNRAENLELAIASYQLALQIYTHEAFPEKWAMTQNNLALAYRDRIGGDRVENLELAIASCQQALQVYTREAFPEQWARTQNNLATAYSDRIRGDRAENLELAIECYRQALEIYTPSAFPLTCLTAGRNLGNLAFELQDWENTLYGYERAISAVEQSREWATSPRRKRQILEDALPLYEKMVQACIQAERYDLALLTIERSKSRTLIELLDNAKLEPKNATNDQKQRLKGLRNQISALQQQLDQAEPLGPEPETETDSSTRQSPSPTATSPSTPLKTVLQTLQQQLNELLIEINDPDFTLTQKVNPQLPDFTQLLNPQTALIEWYLPPNPESGFQVFLVTLTSPSQIHIQPLAFSPEQRQQLDTNLNTYLSDYRKDTWREALSQRLATLSETLQLNTILANLPPHIQKLILIPHQKLHLIPLHALTGTRQHPNSETQTGCLMNLFANGVQYAPSSQFLERLHQRQPLANSNTQPLFAIQNPTEDLHYTEIEVEIISRTFNPHLHILKRRQATKTTLNKPKTLAELRRSHYAHFSCHGVFNSRFPLNSALVLAGETTPPTPKPATPEADNRYVTLRDGRRFDTATQGLTLSEIFANLDLPYCRLVTLSACETGLVDTALTDEYIGLASGFLYAGSSTVVSSLWRVDDFATAFLMIRFYQELNNPKNPSIALALQAAQTWMREVSREDFIAWLRDQLKLDPEILKDYTRRLRLYEKHQPFARPEYWAAFCPIGR